VVGVDADAVAADQAGAEGQEVPFAAGGFQHFQGVDAELVEDQRQLIHQGDVEVALGVLDDFGGFGDADAAGRMGAGGDDLAVEGVDDGGDLWRGAAGDFFDGGQAVVVVAGVDAFGAVAAVEAVGGGRGWRHDWTLERPRGLPRSRVGAGWGVEIGQAGVTGEDGGAVVVGAAGVDGGFVDDQIAGFEDLADGFGRFEQGRQVGAFVVIDRGGHGDDEDAAGAQGLRVAGDLEVAGGGQGVRGDLAGAVVPGLEFGNARGVDVEADHRAVLAEFDRQRQADVAEADDGQRAVGGAQVGEGGSGGAVVHVGGVRSAVGWMRGDGVDRFRRHG